MKQADCVSRKIHILSREHPEWSDDQRVAVAMEMCGQSNKAGVLYADLRDPSWIDRLRYRHLQPRILVQKAADGLRYMELVTSNSYRDRDNETITTKALREYVERSWVANDVFRTRNVFKFWHKITIGDIVWADMEGPFLIEYAKERPGAFKWGGLTHRISKVWDFIDAHPELKWGASHGFKYDSIRINLATHEVIYDHIRKFESSVLPRKFAANPFTHSEVINGKRT